jgi:hypothetical protein
MRRQPRVVPGPRVSRLRPPDGPPPRARRPSCAGAAGRARSLDASKRREASGAGASCRVRRREDRQGGVEQLVDRARPARSALLDLRAAASPTAAADETPTPSSAARRAA